MHFAQEKRTVSTSIQNQLSWEQFYRLRARKRRISSIFIVLSTAAFIDDLSRKLRRKTSCLSSFLAVGD